MTLFENGVILTMDDAHPTADALLMGEGRILAVGSREELRALGGARAEAFDLEGHTLLPGFVDGHSHLVHTAQSLLMAPLSEVESVEEALEALRAHGRDLAPDEWLMGAGYDPRKVPLTRDALDSLGARPVAVSADSGHMACLNSRALALCGLREDSPDPPNGRLGRDEEGRLNGFLEEEAFTAARAHMPAPDPKRLRRGLQKAQRLYASYGLTTVQEGFLDQAGFDLLRDAACGEALSLDVVAYADARTPPCGAVGFGLGRLRVAGYKLFLDGSPQGRTAWLTRPYLPAEGRAEECGYPAASDDEARAAVRRAAAENVQLLTHCNGDAAIDRLLDAHEAPSRTRNVIVHAQLMRPDQLPRVKTLGLMPSYFVKHVERYGDVHVQNLGLERAGGISPLRSTQALGIPFTLHQDTPVLPPDMLDTLRCAILRLTTSGRALGPQERIGLREALRAATVYGAYQYGEEREKGRLLPGLRADLTLAEGDLTLGPEAWPHGGRILGTWKDGVRIYP